MDRAHCQKASVGMASGVVVSRTLKLTPEAEEHLRKQAAFLLRTTKEIGKGRHWLSYLDDLSKWTPPPVYKYKPRGDKDGRIRLRYRKTRTEPIQTRSSTRLKTQAPAPPDLKHLELESWLSKDFATIERVEALTGRTFAPEPLTSYSKDHGFEIQKVRNLDATMGIDAFSAKAWKAVYDVSVKELIAR